VNHLPNSRLRLIMILSVVGFALVIGRAIKIQTIDARELVRRADAQQRHVYDIPVPRGTITDRNGNQLAQQVTWKTLMYFSTPALTAPGLLKSLHSSPSAWRKMFTVGRAMNEPRNRTVIKIIVHRTSGFAGRGLAEGLCTATAGAGPLMRRASL